MAQKKEKQYVSDNAQLMAEWDWEENNRINLYPQEVTHGSKKTANWICLRGHHFSARIDHRTVMGSNCPYCAGKIAVPGENDLATTHPDLLQEWDYESNEHAPEQYIAGSNKKVGWICKNCGHRWYARVVARTTGKTGCPVCMDIKRGKTRTHKTIDRRGSLEKEFPQLFEEWDGNKNLPLLPKDVHGNSRKKVWWLGKCGHSWQATIANRVLGTGCPICAGKTVLAGFNDLASQFPIVASEWVYDLNGDLTPDRISAHNDKKAWWRCPNCEEVYYTSVYSRTSLNTGCPVCHNRMVVRGKNDLETTHPQIAKEWNYQKNKELLPTDLVAGSNKRVWWVCEKGHEWQASISDRKSGRECPVCAQEVRPVHRQQTYLRKNGSLADNHPSVAKQWHPSRNMELTPHEVTSGSGTLAWWMCEKGHEWEAVISSRTAGRGCPYCNNEHSSSYPEQILFFYLSKVTYAVNRHKLHGKEIDIYLPKLNIGIEYNGRYYHKNRTNQDNDKYQFLREQGVRIIIVREGDEMFVDGDTVHYQYMNSDYLNFDFVVKEVLALCKLPSCDVNISRDRAKVYEQYMLMEKANSLAEKYPWLVEEWDYERNGNLTPWQISHGSQKRIHWICRKCGYRWEAVAHSRKGSGCPCCANRVIAKGINDLCTTHPQLAQEWDDIKNEKKPDSIGAGSHQYAWWRCQCGHSWKAQIKSRAKGTGCPMCKRKNAK